MKLMARSAKRTSKAMILPFDQARLVPPHWRARSRQMRQGRRKRVTRGSSWRIFWLGVRFLLKGGVGLRISVKEMRVKAQIGRLTVKGVG